MLEQQRLDYLQAMGVVQWLARQPLPHTPQSRWLASSAEPVAAPAPARALTELLNESAPVVAAAVTAPVLSVVAPEPVAVVDMTPPEFDLFFVRNSFPVVWVVSRSEDVPMLHEFASTVQRALLQKTDFIAAPLRFSWPFIRSRKEDQSRAVALQALRTQWDFFQKQGVQAVLCFDAVSHEWLDAIAAPCVFSAPSLSTCLNSAAHKKALWQALLPYCPV